MKRALLIGSQTGGLRGVEADVDLMAAALAGHGFATTRLLGAEATATGMRAGYRELIAASGPDDAALVYYSGHGGRIGDPAADPSRPAWLQFVVPTDAGAQPGSEPRVVLAEELHLLGRELTARTRNATVVLDCCHAARMSRDGYALPRADPLVPVDAGELARWRDTLRARATPLAGEADSNPDLLRIVGCSPDQSSFELPSAAFGGRVHGALTAALVPLLTTPTAWASTWREVLDIVRRQVLDRVPGQRPEVEGPADRLLFSLETRSASGLLTVRVQGGTPLVDDPALFGVAVGDTYTLTGPGGDLTPIDTAEVVRVTAGRAVLRTVRVQPADLPAGVVARPLRVALGARPVVVLGAAGQQRDALVAALDQAPYLRVADPSDSAPGTERASVLATVRVDDAVVVVHDNAGEPLYTAPLPASEPDRVVRDLTALARAAYVRDLPSGLGSAALPADVEVVALRLTTDGGEVPIGSGDHLFDGDRIAVRATNRAGSTRFVSVLDVGVTGRVALLTTAEPDGTTLGSRETYTLGTDLAGANGIELYWPDGVPATTPRRETIVVVVADRKIDGLTRLEQEGVVSRSRGAAPGSALELLLDDVASGVRDARPAAGGRPLAYRVERFDVVFHPTSRPVADEPRFTVVERPDESFRLVLPRGIDVPSRVAVRLKELTVTSTRSFLRARVRVDALAVTSVPAGAGMPYAAGTARFDRVRDGDRLSFDDLLVYEGPVGRFLDLAVWVSRDDSRDLDLTELLSRQLSDTKVASALTTLAGLAVAAPAAALVAGSAAAVAVLVRTAARAVETVRGASIGTYRTSLLPHQRFGTAPPPRRVGRHPARGLIEAQDIRFAYEVVDLSEGPG